MASGRTDAGVHAFGQVVRLIVPWEIPCDALKNALNSLLAPDVRVRKVFPSDPSFHPVRDTVWKEYFYLFSSGGGTHHPLFYDMIANIGCNPDREKMEQAARVFEGKHDFCNYYTSGGNTKTTRKLIYESRIEPSEILFPLMEEIPSLHIYRVRGNGFLKQMVRLMMGAIVEVGRGKASLEDIRRSLAEPKGEKLGAVAPARGLYLRQVFYEKA